MELVIGLALLAIAAVPLAYSIYRSNELFVLQVRDGKVELMRGKLPQGLLSDLEDVFARSSANADIRVVSEQRRPRAIVRGANDELAQRVRNVVGRFRVAEIRNGRRVARR